MDSKAEVKLTVLPGAQDAWSNHWNQWRACKLCAIGRHAYRHVLARGEIPCDVLFIGEAPGENEDIQGYPFVGRAGKLFDEWIAPYDDLRIAVTNVVACRPFNRVNGKKTNRPPSEEEKENCRPRLNQFIKIANPMAVVFVGKHAAEAEMELPENCKKLGIYHPSYILRTGVRGGPADLRERQKLAAFLEGML